jgi:aspartyl-tRNA(Asn)/glutamyl-tRNA(Gln) amidotransferase subunit A
MNPEGHSRLAADGVAPSSGAKAPAVARLPDWSDIPPTGRDLERKRCAGRVALLGPRLKATLEVFLDRTCGDSAGGPLDRLPYATKDMFDRRDRRATWGGVRTRGPLPRTTASVLDRLDRAGACEVAVSSMTELAYEPSGYNALHGRTLNPWHPDAVSGGSSSGSAALVAVGAVYLGLGSDTGGSIRMPATCCGITGLKPSAGAVPCDGAMPLAPSLDVIGFLARSARDVSLAWAVAADHPPASEDAEASRAVVLGDCIRDAAAAVRHAIGAGIEALRAVGLSIGNVAAQASIEHVDAHALVVMQAESARSHRAGDFDEGRLDAALLRRLTKGRTITNDALAASLAERPRLAAAFLDSWGDADVAVLPVMPCETPLATETDPQSSGFSPRTLYRMSSLTRFVNFLGLPAISVPCGFDGRGVPIGLQLIGRPAADTLLLGLAERLQAITDWHGRVPPAASAVIEGSA